MSAWWSLSPLASWWQWWLASDSMAQQLAAGPCLAACTAVLVALLVDRLCGEPPTWLHPVVAMGRVLGLLGAKIAPGPTADSTAKLRPWLLGALAWCALAVAVAVIYASVQRWMPSWGWCADGLLWGVLLKPLLSWRMLRSEVQAVEQALQTSLPAGRQRLSWLVSRDTSQLDAGTVRESAIETLAENLSDSVVAPLLWFLLLGLPGAAVYRMANTADAMWGYPGWRGQGTQRRNWQWAGKWAARADDVLNWLPARVTALLLAAVGPGIAWQALRRDAGTTPSPNGGWPMGAMAQALRVRLGKPGVYVLNPAGSVPGPQHVQQALQLAARAVGLMVVVTGMSLSVMWGLTYAA